MISKKNHFAKRTRNEPSNFGILSGRLEKNYSISH